MNKKFQVFLSMGLFFLAFAFQGVGHSLPGVKTSDELELIKKLEGMWEGTVESDGKTEPAKIRYLVTSGGTAVVEILFPEMPNETVSVYYDNENGLLEMQNFSELSVKPQMDLTSSSDKQIDFTLSSYNQFDVKQLHLQGLTMLFPNAGALVRRASYYQGKSVHHEMIISVKKVAE